MKLIVGIVVVLLGSLLSTAGALDEGKKDGSASNSEANSRQNALMVLAGLVIQLFAIVEAWW